MTPESLILALAAWLTSLGLATAALRRHRTAVVVGGQLIGLGGILAILALLGAEGALFAVVVAVMSCLLGLLVLMLLQSEDVDTGADTSLAAKAEEVDPLRW